MKKQNLPQPILAGYKRPQWICSNQKQSVIILADRSSSMTGEKIEQSTTAIEDFVITLAKPENKDAIYIIIVEYNDTANVIQDIIKATDLVGNIPSMDACGWTDMASALSCAKSQVDSDKLPKLENVTWLKPVIIFFSDGNHNTGDDPVIVADELKEKATIVTIAYGNDADEDLLLRLASSSQHYFRCQNGKEIRDLLPEIGVTLTNSITDGKEPADEIAKMER